VVATTLPERKPPMRQNNDRPYPEETNQPPSYRVQPTEGQGEMSEAELEQIVGGTPAHSMYSKIIQAQHELKKGIIANFRV
jgi:hypothetical protein